MDTLGGIFAGIVATYLVYGGGFTAGSVGFTLTLISAFSGVLVNWIRFLNEAEVQANRLVQTASAQALVELIGLSVLRESDNFSRSTTNLSLRKRVKHQLLGRRVESLESKTSRHAIRQTALPC
jgi:hypothetical protein